MKTLNTIYLWLMLAACMLALAGCVEENVSGTGEGGNISVKMNVNARGGSDIQAEMENAVKSLRVYAFIGQKQIGYYYGEAGLNPDAGGKISFWMDLKLPPYSALEQNVWFYLVANEKAILRPSATLQENMTRDELEKFYFEEIKARGYGAVPMVARQSQKIDPNNLKESTAGGSHNGHLMWNGTVEFELERVVGKLGMYFAAKEAGMNLSIERIDFLGVLQYNYLFHPEDAVWKEVPPLDSPFELLTTSSPVTKVMTDADYELLNKKDPESIKKGFNDFFSVPVYMFENYYGSGNPNSWGTADTEHKGFVVRVTYSINGNQSVKDIYLPQVKRNTYCVVLNRIGPDDHGDRLLRVRKRRGFERSIDLHALALQRFCRENLPAHDALQRQAQIDGNPLRHKKKENRNGSGDCRREKPDQTPCENLAARSFGAEPPEKPLQNGNQLADGDHRVRKAVRVADQKIEKRTEQQRIQGPFHEQAPPFCSVKIQTGFCAFIRW